MIDVGVIAQRVELTGVDVQHRAALETPLHDDVVAAGERVARRLITVDDAVTRLRAGREVIREVLAEPRPALRPRRRARRRPQQQRQRGERGAAGVDSYRYVGAGHQVSPDSAFDVSSPNAGTSLGRFCRTGPRISRPRYCPARSRAARAVI